MLNIPHSFTASIEKYLSLLMKYKAVHIIEHALSFYEVDLFVRNFSLNVTYK